MNQWQEFEAQQGDGQALNNFVCGADQLGLILVNGADARDFLQNQLSNDIDFIDESRYQMSSYSTPKGRLVGIFRVIRITNGYLLLTPRSMVLPLMERLFKYIVQAQVTLADASDYFARFALQTDDRAVHQHALLPATPGDVLQNDSVISLQLEPLGEQRRFLLMCLSADEAISLWNEFAARLQVAGFRALRLSEIRAGIPVIYPETSEEFVLQMANLGMLDGVSFKKGCYPGQEIVARMQYLGKLKRRMFLAQFETDKLPRPGDALVLEGKSEVDGSGMVVDAEFDSEGVCHCLYIAQIERAENDKLRFLAQPEVRLHNRELPYSINSSI
jgi:folate-binding protein YgfZ